MPLFAFPSKVIFESYCNRLFFFILNIFNVYDIISMLFLPFFYYGFLTYFFIHKYIGLFISWKERECRIRHWIRMICTKWWQSQRRICRWNNITFFYDGLRFLIFFMARGIMFFFFFSFHFLGIITCICESRKILSIRKWEKRKRCLMFALMNNVIYASFIFHSIILTQSTIMH